MDIVHDFFQLHRSRLCSDIEGEDCGIFACDLAGYYGEDCGSQCPGMPGAVCSDNGKCDQGKLGTGRCRCNRNWGGPNCKTRCPECAFGSCNEDAKECICDVGYFAQLCDSRCPHFQGL
eukprot:gene12031-3549_t